MPHTGTKRDLAVVQPTPSPVPWQGKHLARKCRRFTPKPGVNLRHLRPGFGCCFVETPFVARIERKVASRVSRTRLGFRIRGWCSRGGWHASPGNSPRTSGASPRAPGMHANPHGASTGPRSVSTSPRGVHTEHPLQHPLLAHRFRGRGVTCITDATSGFRSRAESFSACE